MSAHHCLMCRYWQHLSCSELYMKAGECYACLTKYHISKQAAWFRLHACLQALVRMCAGSSLLAALPSMVQQIKHPTRTGLLLGMTNSALAFFLFSYQVLPLDCATDIIGAFHILLTSFLHSICLITSFLHSTCTQSSTCSKQALTEGFMGKYTRGCCYKAALRPSKRTEHT